MESFSFLVLLILFTIYVRKAHRSIFSSNKIFTNLHEIRIELGKQANLVAAFIILALLCSYLLSAYFACFIFVWFAYNHFIEYKAMKRYLGISLMGFLKIIVNDVRTLFVFVVPILVYFTYYHLFDFIIPGGVGEVLLYTFSRFIFISLLTILTSVPLILIFLPNTEISDDEYFQIIKQRMDQVGLRSCRLHWINIPHFYNAFVIGFSFFGLSNQTMFVGTGLRDKLTVDEFDAVICHELGHIMHKHLLKRILYMSLNGFLVMIPTFLLIGFAILSTYLIQNYPGDPNGFEFFKIFLVVGVFSLLFLTTSLTYRISRFHEYQADLFALKLLGDKKESLSLALEKLSFQKPKKSKLRFLGFLRTHPELIDRVNFHQNPQEPKLLSLPYFLNWKVGLASLLLFSGIFFYGLYEVHQTKKLHAEISAATVSELSDFKDIKKIINRREFLFIGDTPLEVACENGEFEKAKALIELGADPAKGSYESSPLTLSFMHKNFSQDVFNLIISKVDQEQLKATSYLLFAIAVKSKDSKRFQVLIDHKLDQYLTKKSMAKVSKYQKGFKPWKDLVDHKLNSKEALRAPASQD